MREPDDPPRASHRAVSGGDAAGDLGENARRRDRRLVRAARQGDAGRRRLPPVGRPVELLQRRQSQLVGDGRRAAARRGRAGMAAADGPARRICGPRHLAHGRHARHRQQHHRHRQRIRAGSPRRQAERSSRRQGAGRRAQRQSDLPHAVLLLCAVVLCRADAGRSARRLCAFPRVDQAAQGGRRLIGCGEDQRSGADGARCGRSRRRRNAAAPRLAHAAVARGGNAGASGALDPRFLARVRTHRRGDGHADGVERHGGVCRTSNPIQRAWRDVRFAATHISLNTEINYGHFGRIEFGLPRDPARPFF